MKRLLLLFVLAVFITSAASAHAAFDMFLKIDGVDGESQDKDHSKWIEVQSFSHSVSRGTSTSAGAGRSRGDVEHSEFSIVKELDMSSPLLSMSACKGDSYNEVKLELVSSFGTFMRYTLYDAELTSVSPSGSVDDLMPVEEVTFSYDKIRWEYVPYDSAGKALSAIDRTWNVEQNRQE